MSALDRAPEPAHYFTSDVHLRHDQPERSARFAHWVEGIEPGAALTILGDLCDFWYAARERRRDPLECPGLRALADFRARGGTLTLLAGNHDLWLGPLFESALGATFVPEPLERTVHGLRLLLVHGHRLGGRPFWKGWLESRAFLAAFEALPGPIARAFDRWLEAKNVRDKALDDVRHLACYRAFVASCGERADLVVLGHIHLLIDDGATRPRMIVLGSWHRRGCFLKLDGRGASLHLVDAPADPLSSPSPLHHAQI